MASFDFTIREGTTKRIQLTGVDANGVAYNYTGATVDVIVKAKSADAIQAVGGSPPYFQLVVSGAGVGTSTPAGRMFLGRPNPAAVDGALIDTAASTGYLTIRFAPEDTTALVTTANKAFVWECRVTTGAADAYTLGSGTITVEDSLFDN
ncbi:MAG: hypothetical protein M3440_06665 [Chloroflexota bacterium]|nr:hypothetical protein [Chloroflexota bacterium]